jgi:glycolate oxidase iron-sulfur subunit
MKRGTVFPSTFPVFMLSCLPVKKGTMSYLKDLDYSVVQQCMHCGMCLPTCPTYMETKLERNSPRGRISLMRAIADGRLEAAKAFSDEMYFCLGCLACETACPAGVDYTQLFEMARAEAERSPADQSPLRKLFRWALLDVLFGRQWRLRLVGRMLWIYQACGLQALVRISGVLNLLPKSLRGLEAKTPVIQRHFSPDLIAEVETPALDSPRSPIAGFGASLEPQTGVENLPSPSHGVRRLPSDPKTYRVGLLTGCVQDLIYSDVNRDTADVLLANDCTVITPHTQGCCGSLHAHNGEYEMAKGYARRLIDQFDLDQLDAVITNAAGCGSHLKHFDRLLKDDPAYAAKATQWSALVKDVSEWLVQIDFRAPENFPQGTTTRVTYHDACHLCHGQKITAEPRELLAKIPGLEVKPLTESMWCCGSAGIYNLIQPEMADKLLQRKLDHIAATGATIVATGNPGCLLQIQNGLRARGTPVECVHPVSLLAQAYRK